MSDVVIVEDHPHLLLLYQIELRHAGHSVRPASTVDEYLEEVNGQVPDLVILDLHLPGSDGTETLAAVLRATPAHVPVIVNTAYDAYRKAMPRDRRIAYVLKSSDLTELNTWVRRFLDGAGQFVPPSAERRSRQAPPANPE